MSKIIISVVICTHNRAALLSLALESLAAQDATLPASEHETLVVDNCSTDGTRQIVESFMGKIANLRYIFEEKVGLSHARNRGWQEAQGEYIGYLDDDAIASPDWLNAAQNVILEQSPEIFGGPFYAYYNTPKPDWIPCEFGSRSFGDEACVLNSDYLSGGNMFVRREVFSQVGGFDPRLGMSGQKISYAEEVFLQQKVRTDIPESVIYYDPKVFIYHLVRAEKASLLWMIQAKFASGRDFVIARIAITNISLVALLILAVKVCFYFFVYGLGLILRDRRRYPFYQTYVYDKILPVIFKAGRLLSMLILLFRLP